MTKKEVFRTMELHGAVKVEHNGKVYVSNINPGYAVKDSFVSVWGQWGSGTWSVNSVLRAIENNLILKAN